VENKQGGGRVSQSRLRISWPYQIETGHSSGKWLLYLMDLSVVRLF